MSKLQIILGAGGSGKTEYLIRKALQEAGKDYHRQIYYLVPEQDTLAMQKRIVSHSENHGKGILNVDVLSFQRLYYRAFENTNQKSPLSLDEMGKMMILRLILGKKKKQLSYYQREAESLSFVEECKSQISECMQYKVSPEDLRKCAEKSKRSITRAKFLDLAYIYEEFLLYLSKTGRITEEGLADQGISALWKDNTLKDSILIFDGFTGFTPIQLLCIEVLMERAGELYFSLEFSGKNISALGNGKKRESLFYLTEEAIKELYQRGEKLGVEILSPLSLNEIDSRTGEGRPEGSLLPRFEKIPALQTLVEGFLQGENQEPETKEEQSPKTENMDKSKPYTGGVYPSVPHGISVIEAANISKEVEEACSHIRYLVEERGYRYQEIGVVLPDVELYRDAFFHQGRKFAIPLFLEEDIKLFDSPFSKVLRSALEVMEKGLLYDSFFRYLRAFPYRGMEEEDRIDALENEARAKGLKGKSAFRSLFQEESLLEAEALFSLLEENEGSHSLKERIESLESFTEKLMGLFQLEEEAIFLKNEGMDSLSQSLERSVSQIQLLLSKMKEGLGEIPVNKKEFSAFFDMALSLEKLRQIPATNDQVLVGDLTRSRFHNPKAFLFLGLNAGLIPLPPKKKSLFTEEEKSFLRQEHCTLSPLAWEESYIQEFYLYHAFLSPKEDLYLSYPLRIPKGRGGISPILQEVLRLFPKLKIRKLDREIQEMQSFSQAKASLSKELPKLCKREAIFRSEEEVLPYFQLESFQLLHSLWQKEEYKKDLEKLLDAVFWENRHLPLSKELSKELYGEKIRGSVSRLEGLNRCAFFHFLRYGLHLQERKEAEIQAFDLGNLYHKLVESFFKKLKEEKLKGEALSEHFQEYLNFAIAESEQDPEFAPFLEGGRNQYFLHKFKENAKTILWALERQLSGGDFQVEALERDFHYESDTLSFRGRVDRVDSYLDEEKNYYLKVLDYKSGNTDFSLDLLKAGLQIQLPLYLSILLEEERKRHPDYKLHPAGLFYFTMDNPSLSFKGQTEEELFQEKLKASRPKGLINGDKDIIFRMDRELKGDSLLLPVKEKNGAIEEKGSVAKEEKILAMLSYVRERVEEDCKRILEGEKDISPIREAMDKTACTYCPYHSICGFDPDLPGFSYRSMEKGEEEAIWDEWIEKYQKKEQEDAGV